MDLYRFTLEGRPTHFEGHLTLDNLQLLADYAFKMCAWSEVELVVSHATRRELIRLIDQPCPTCGTPKAPSLTIEGVQITAAHHYADKVIGMRPQGVYDWL